MGVKNQKEGLSGLRELKKNNQVGDFGTGPEPWDTPRKRRLGGLFRSIPFVCVCVSSIINQFY